ncbi:MAG: DHH family phosphoesterase [Thermoplasmatales archaeon]|nr:DHH family phosphoesterase [Thermoplasmatales archaeon]
MLEELQGNGLLIHHWDTDGICSARLLLEYLKDKDITNKTPGLGNYFLTEDELKEYSAFDFVVVADMSLPKENILTLAKNSEVAIFDHHLGPVIKEVFHHNPIIKGEDPNKYPSASWIINSYLKNPVNLFAILGILGDHEKRILNNSIFSKIIDDFCKENNLTFDDLLNMVYLIDSNYKIGDRTEIENMPHLFLKIKDHNDILNNSKWNKNLKELNNEISKQLKMPAEEINGLILKKIHTPYSIISTITRQISWKSKKDTLVINTGFFSDSDELYVRSSKNLEPMIMRGKNLGFKCGGKKEVLGSIVPKDQTDSFVKEILEFLK